RARAPDPLPEPARPAGGVRGARPARRGEHDAERRDHSAGRRPPDGAALSGGMSETDRLLENNRAYSEGFDKADLAARPSKRVAVLACMDARLIPTRILGLGEGEAHVLRNAGGVVTDDAIRSLAISQNLLGTEEIVLIHHTDCGMLTFTDDEFAAKLEDETG